ncbi:MAG TPA: HAD-IA family hydrolase [Solirubrobacterales bacterium]|jgi:sugar-phosphatase|nr:HAD-IA family hydrolase [Solirubrobacterales bacterium]
MSEADIWAPAAILADLDGTLVDSVASSERAWGAFARRRGRDEGETHRFAMGRPTRETVALLVPEEERDAEQGQIDRDEVDDAGSVTAYPGAAELLAGPIPLAVVTSGSTELATARLRGAGLEVPAVLITADKIERGKPDPEPFLLGARGLGVDPARCLALEDAPPGIESALAAGMPVVAFRTSHPESELERATIVLDSLAEAAARLLPSA